MEDMHECVLYEKMGNKAVRCKACAHRCTIQEGKTGICGIRGNIDGKLYLFVYGRPSAVNIDPIEKKPFFHFHPGTRAYSIGTFGCNFRCKFCQNWDLSQFPKAIAYGQGAEIARKAVEERSIPLPPEKAVSEAVAYGCEGMAYTYNEPTIFSEYAVDTAKIAKKKGLYNVYVSNGFITEESIEYADGYIDAYNIDIKGDDRFYRELSGARLEPVLEAVKELKKRKKWVEITTLIIPGWNDSKEFLRWVAKWIADVDKGMPWHVTRFYPAYQMMDVPPTEERTLLRAWEIGKEEGLSYVYVGNISAGEKENTYCPKCKFLLIERRWFDVVRNNIKNGKCPECGRRVEGVWD